MKYFLLVLLILAVASKNKQEFNCSKILNGGFLSKQDCQNLYIKGWNYLSSYCSNIESKLKDEIFCMNIQFEKQADYQQYGTQVCDDEYTCEKYNDDSVYFMIAEVFKADLPYPSEENSTESGRGLHFWFTEGAKLMQSLTNDKCQRLAGSLH